MESASKQFRSGLDVNWKKKRNKILNSGIATPVISYKEDTGANSTAPQPIHSTHTSDDDLPAKVDSTSHPDAAFSPDNHSAPSVKNKGDVSATVENIPWKNSRVVVQQDEPRQISYGNINTIVNCAHKIKSKNLSAKHCSMCDMQDEIGSMIKLYYSGMHPGADGREKIFRWHCVLCKSDLFGTKTQILNLAPLKTRKKRPEGSEKIKIGFCETLHGWNTSRPEYVKQCARRVFEVITGYPSDDTVTDSGFTCYNSNVLFAIYVEDGYPLLPVSSPKTKEEILSKLIKKCTSYGKFLLAINKFFSNKYSSEEILEAVIICIYDYLLDKDLLQKEFTPNKFIVGNEEIIVGGISYLTRSYMDKKAEFMNIVKNILAEQVSRHKLYEDRPTLTGIKRFIVNAPLFY